MEDGPQSLMRIVDYQQPQCLFIAPHRIKKRRHSYIQHFTSSKIAFNVSDLLEMNMLKHLTLIYVRVTSKVIYPQTS